MNEAHPKSWSKSRTLPKTAHWDARFITVVFCTVTEWRYPARCFAVCSSFGLRRQDQAAPRGTRVPGGNDLAAAACSAIPERFCVLNSLYQPAKCSISNVEQCARFTGSGGWAIEDQRCQKIGGGYTGSEVQIFTVSLNGANLSTPIQSPTS
jgi:hypothetical protein